MNHDRPVRLGLALLLAAGGAVLGVGFSAAAQPANDLCANAIAIGNTTVSGTTVGASNDFPGTCGASSASPDVWYRYTATATATITVTLCGGGTGYDSVLDVITTCGGSEIACNDDSCGLQSQVTFQAVNGSAYLVRVSGYNSSVGSFTLSIGHGGGGSPPSNDTCASAIPIGNGAFNGTTSDAASDGSASCGVPGGPDVFYLYTAPATGLVTASTCAAANFDTIISVHSGCPADTNTQIACNDTYCNAHAQVQFQASQGTPYIIRVAGSASSGNFTLTMGDPPSPGPSGPDVTLQATDATYLGAVSGINAYAIGSQTCNLGDSDLSWTGFGTPALGMNAYRLYNGRLLQLGLGFCKTACCAGASSGCGTCNGHGGNVLGAGCKDTYGASYNGDQVRLAPRSSINGFNGAMTAFPHTTGDAVYRRLQIPATDLNPASFPGSLYFIEGVYVGTDDALSGNGLNNATYQRVTVSGTALSNAGSSMSGIPAIRAWRDHGLGADMPDTRVNVFPVDVPSEGRFWVATKVTALADSRYLYDYAIFNLNSDRCGGSFSVPRAAGVNPINLGFHDVNYHSGEPYDNTDWASGVGPTAISWSSPQTFAQNPNSNALRWGTMYNFWFEANTAPVTGTVTLGLFKPGTPSNVSFEAPVPSPGCAGDWNHDGVVTSQDFFDFMAAFFNGNADFNNNGVTDSQDFFDFLGAFFNGC